MVRDGVHTLAIWTIGARSSASCPWRRSVDWPISVARDRLARQCKGWGDVVLTSIRFRLLVNTRQIRVGCFGIPIGRRVLLEPETKLHVIPEQLWANFMVSIQHNSLVMATAQSAHILQ